MKKLLGEPLTQFLLLGVLLFGAWSLARGGGEGGEDRIVVSAAQVERLVASFRLTWQRPPTETELAGLIQDYLKEEIYYRQALALGFDQDDQVVRRRLRQKMEFLTDDVAGAVEPTRQELQDFLDANPDLFRLDTRFTFQHAYFSVDRRGAAAEADARAVLEAAEGRLDPMSVGDPFVLPHGFRDVTSTQVASSFGRDFAEALEGLEVGAWAGPVPSGYGVHLVRVDARQEGGVPPLDRVQDQVRRELLARRRQETEDAVYESLRAGYTVRVEWPEGMTPLELEGVGS